MRSSVTLSRIAIINENYKSHDHLKFLQIILKTTVNEIFFFSPKNLDLMALGMFFPQFPAKSYDISLGPSGYQHFSFFIITH